MRWWRSGCCQLGRSVRVLCILRKRRHRGRNGMQRLKWVWYSWLLWNVRSRNWNGLWMQLSNNRSLLSYRYRSRRNDRLLAKRLRHRRGHCKVRLWWCHNRLRVRNVRIYS